MYLFLTFDYSVEEKRLENTLPHKWQQGMQKKLGQKSIQQELLHVKLKVIHKLIKQDPNTKFEIINKINKHKQRS